MECCGTYMFQYGKDGMKLGKTTIAIMYCRQPQGAWDTEVREKAYLCKSFVDTNVGGHGNNDNVHRAWEQKRATWVALL